MKPSPDQSRLDLDDLALFLAVAGAGSLSAAARATDTSLPTLGRRMTRLEVAMGRRLFRRGSAGYALTADGRALATEAADLQTAAHRIARWRDAGPRAVRVRVTAGLWTSRHLARKLRSYWTEDLPWAPEFLASNKDVDIARREADIGIRNRRPDQGWLAGRRTRRIDYAEYGRDASVAGFVTQPADSAGTPSERWLRANHADRIAMVASDARLALDLALQGAGRILLPCFAGDAEPGLARLSDPIAEIGHDEWLVCHHEARNDPPVRAALDAIAGALRDPA
ncbi:LysR family transcriptional regulator [Tropicimonas sp. IMCC34043]|uniref:LysR family transcriptional regulator n=1 Tax=Tropicimonas sp. IMCC34043 TaxID=2248760 RepID=UPI000E2553C0|nr:LysR family transcriptional regulator [Tropicimonas sp. IMCC34043]